MATPVPTPAPHLLETGLRIIIAYKVGKAVAWFTLAIILGLGLRYGLDNALQEFIVRVHMHLSRMWAIHVADWLIREVTRRHLFVVLVAISIDCVASAVEAWALYHDKWWGEWLVVLTTGLLLPFEAYEIVIEPRVGRILVLVINAGIVAYLAQRIRRQQAAQTAPTASD